MKKERCAIIIILLGLVWCDIGFCASDRVALVIGNKDYKGTARLTNPINDANDLSQALRRLEFDVIKKTNLTRKEMRDSLRHFKQAIKPEGVALFYFSGHGMQVPEGGENYLIPIGADIQGEEEVSDSAVSAKFVIDKMKSARSKVNIVILDACRNNPYTGHRSSSQGLAPVARAEGLFIAYSTAPGTTAHDNPRGRNSLYTKSLLEEIETPGLAIPLLFQQVRTKVRAESIKSGKKKQVPWDASGLYGKPFYFIPPTSTNPPIPPTSTNPPNNPPQGNPNPGTVEKTRYINNGDGTITDTETGLMWKRCPEGLSGKKCEVGKVKKYRFNDAVKRFKNVSYAGYDDWRMPTIDELKTLVYCSKGVKDKNDGECNDGSTEPTINQQAFPNTKYSPFSVYWSGSPSANISDNAWRVYFNYGHSGAPNRGNNSAVRLVRGEKKIGKYIDNRDGTITDTETKLMWKRCSEGLSGKKCEEGKVKKYEWNDAVKRFKNVSYADYTDWRLPTVDELKTLVYCSKGVKNKKNGECNKGSTKPTINQKAFPNTTSRPPYWSSSPYAYNSDYAWSVYFGNVSRLNNFAVRLVRSGQ